MSDIWKAVTPYVVIDILCLVITVVFPATALYLPNLMGMK